MEGVENAARAAAFLVRYHARLAAGDTENVRKVSGFQRK